MRWFLIIGGSLFALFIVFCAIIFIWGFGVIKQEAITRNVVVAKQQTNTTDFDNMWKTQIKVCQLPAAQEDLLKNIVVGYAKARADGQPKGGGLITMTKLQEVIPNVDVSMYKTIMNIIVSTGESFADRQKELVALNLAHTNIITVPPGSFVCSLFGKEVINIQLVTSERTQNAFKTGQDNDVNLNLTPPPAAPATK